MKPIEPLPRRCWKMAIKRAALSSFIFFCSVTALSENLYSSLFLPLCLFFTGVTRSVLTARVPFSTSPYLEPVSRRWVVRSIFTHQSWFSFTAEQETVLLATRWLHNGYKKRKLKYSHFYSLFFFLIAPRHEWSFFWLWFSSSSLFVNRIYFKYMSSLSLSVSIKLAAVSLTCALTLKIGCCCHFR